MAKAKQSMPQASKAERERVLAVFRAAYEAGALAGLVSSCTRTPSTSPTGRQGLRGTRVWGRQRHPDRVDIAEVGGELAQVFYREGVREQVRSIVRSGIHPPARVFPTASPVRERAAPNGLRA
ncbi:hypothetical protein [Streptomyces sp. S465]|uniref:hypothetical protein n=1 Tax=Streptomyces sp. S465 TaxID=2979468 RepID=UPI0022A81B5D|nr:hypothetical protein [Streptomyces sp. S465]WAP53605.1 hypothetical protein N6H00_00820 [Streptomyces sp. S465]